MPSPQNDAKLNEYKNYDIAFNHFLAAMQAKKQDNVAALALEYGDVFDIEAAFFFYALDFGLEVATEYWMHTKNDAEQKLMSNIQQAFANVKTEEQATGE